MIRKSVSWLVYGVPIGLAIVGGFRGLGGARPAMAVPATTTAAAEPLPETKLPDLPKIRFGDAWLKGEIDLGKMTLDGDRYTVPLSGGRTAVLTLDPALQARAEAILDEAAAPYGAVVMMSVDGRLLALAARSAEGDLSDSELLLRPWAPAASVFKIVTSAALVDAGIEPETEVCYHGGLRSVDADNLVDDSRRDGTCHDFAYGLARSQNAIMAKLAARHLDAGKLRKAAEQLGFGKAPELALPLEPSTADIPEKSDDEGLAFARVAAGFWQTELSPVGGALLTGTIATSGLRVTPRIVAAVIDEQGEEQAILPRAPVRVMDPDTADTVGEMMLGTTEVGTAWRGFHDSKGRRLLGDAQVAGKTGSLSRKTGSHLNYSWFVGYAPADAPSIVVSVLLGNSATWRFKAHTVARLVLETALAE